MSIIEKLKQNANSGDLCLRDTEDMSEAAEMLTAFMQILECFGSCEGTWFENEWKTWGVSEEMRAKINAEWEHFNSSNAKVICAERKENNE